MAPLVHGTLLTRQAHKEGQCPGVGVDLGLKCTQETDAVESNTWIYLDSIYGAGKHMGWMNCLASSIWAMN